MASSRKAVRAVDAQGLLKHLHHFLENHLLPQASITLGLSGGGDSCVLLHLLVQLRQSLDFQLSAIHVNHQISLNAGEWAIFCEKLCAGLNVPLKVIVVDVPRKSGLGLEAAAREARYEALLEHGSNTLVLAHHQDDQAETLLLQLLRGAGMDGLSAMPAVGQVGAAKVFRPLLGISRSALQTYAKAAGLNWIEDESNQDSRFGRNFLRNEVMPLLRSRFPACTTTLARSVANFSDAAAVLVQVATEDAVNVLDSGRLNIQLLATFSVERSVNLLRWWIQAETGLSLSRSRLYEILEQICHARPEARVECQLGSVVLRRYRDWVYIDGGLTVAPYAIRWDGQTDLVLPDGSRLVMNKVIGDGLRHNVIGEGLVVSNRAGRPDKGDLEIRLHEDRPRRTLKNLWQEAGVPPWERERMPLIWMGDSLAAVPGQGIALAFKAGGGESGCVPEWREH